MKWIVNDQQTLKSEMYRLIPEQTQ
ncbi:hypothetical protein PBAL39_17779 [Pedobacter sp. BAL39]|nr:hypothetical protein PBAL39_17779 [Pedobacter sp. BAL39]